MGKVVHSFIYIHTYVSWKAYLFLPRLWIHNLRPLAAAPLRLKLRPRFYTPSIIPTHSIDE